MSYYLATIVRDLDVKFDFDKTKVELPDISKVTEFLKSMQFYGFIKNINSILAAFNPDENTPVQANPEQDNKVVKEEQIQLGLFSEAVHAEINKNSNTFSHKIITTKEELQQLRKTLESKHLISFDIKAEIKNAVDNLIIGIAFAYKNENDDAEAFYIPINHTTLTVELNTDDVMAELKPIFESNDIKKATYDVKVEYSILRALNIELNGVVSDVQLASYIKNPSRKHDLEIQSMENLNHAICEFANFEEIKKKKIKLQDANIENVGEVFWKKLFMVFEKNGWALIRLEIGENPLRIYSVSTEEIRM